MEKINNEELYFYKLKSAEHRCISDHCSFVEAGIPAVFLMTLGEEHK
jgi:Zn-dependent M28 family amino/carboxypeptidase